LPSRSYDVSGRRAAADRNREAVVLACRDLLLQRGYQSTTIRAVADRAGVSPELVYKSFGGKQGLMKAVYDRVLAGDDDPTPIGQRQQMREIFAVADAREKIGRYAGFVRGLMERLGGLGAVLAEADPEVAEVRTATECERLRGVRAFLGHLAEAGHLVAGADLDRAADGCWVLTSPAVHTQLTTQRGWNAARYEAWLADVLIATIPLAEA